MWPADILHSGIYGRGRIRRLVASPSRAEFDLARLVLNGDNMLGLCDPSNLLLILSAQERRALLKLL